MSEHQELGLFWASRSSGIAFRPPPAESLKVCSGALLSPPFSVLLLAALVLFFPTATVLRTLSKSRMQVDEGRIRSEVSNASSWVEIRMQPYFLWHSLI